MFVDHKFRSVMYAQVTIGRSLCLREKILVTEKEGDLGAISLLRSVERVVLGVELGWKLDVSDTWRVPIGLTSGNRPSREGVLCGTASEASAYWSVPEAYAESSLDPGEICPREAALAAPTSLNGFCGCEGLECLRNPANSFV